MAPPDLVVMKVAQLTVDPFTNMPLVILRDEAGTRAVEISVGVIEASAIATELEKIPLARPMTHDLMKKMLVECGVRVERVEIRERRGHVFYATILLQRAAGKPVEVDARPSDAIALALRTGATIQVARSVIEALPDLGGPEAGALTAGEGGPQPYDPAASAVSADAQELLEALADEDFGKWKM
jgi:bifunctional DNase/RNase